MYSPAHQHQPQQQQQQQHPQHPHPHQHQHQQSQLSPETTHLPPADPLLLSPPPPPPPPPPPHPQQHAQHQLHNHQYLPPHISSVAPSPHFNTTFFVMPDSTNMPPAKPSRVRRKSAPGAEAVKHRRTRSGCFTCRTRRVKCDETHPVCERCQKGGRECTYPEVVPSSSKSTGSQKKRDRPSGSREGSSSLEDLEEEEGEGDHASPGESSRLRPSASMNHLRGATERRESWPSSDQSRKARKSGSSLDPSPSPHDHYAESSTPTSPAESLGRVAFHDTTLVNPADWSHLPHDVAFYLNYHLQMLTCHHYLLKNDYPQFFKSTLLEMAANNDALLYAVAAFSSFHYSVHYKTGIFQTFLEYYNKSIGLLRVALDGEHTLSTVVTILQLASFEEYLGDWMSLMEHRNAASKIIQALWNPVSMAENDDRRMVFNWFTHFDVLVAMMSGHSTSIAHEWAEANHQAVRNNRAANPDSIVPIIEDALCALRETAMKASIMTARRAQNQVTIEEFLKESNDMLEHLATWRANANPLIFRGAESISPLPSSDPDDACPFKCAPIYKGVRWPVNFMECDLYGLEIVLKHQIALTNNTGPEASLADYAIKICEILAAIEAYPDAPSGALLPAQAAIGLAALWIPKDTSYRRWIQKQLAKEEQMGFVYPLAFRTRMAELWEDPQIKHTWIHSDSETAIGVSIRQLVDMRDAEFPKDAPGQDIKALRTLMTEMRLDSKGTGKLPQITPDPQSEPSNLGSRIFPPPKWS